MLSTMYFGSIKDFAKSRKRYGKNYPAEPVLSVIFEAIAKQFIRLHSKGGMVVPVNIKQGPKFFRLLVAGDNWEEEKVRYSSFCWYKGKKQASQRKSGRGVILPNALVGWSNFPFIAWVIGYLVQEGAIRFEDKSDLLHKDSPKPTLDDAGPSFIIENCDKSFTLVTLVQFLLFGLCEEDNQAICQAIDSKFEMITKDNIFNDIEMMFSLDGKGKYKLGGRLKSLTSTDKEPIGSQEQHESAIAVEIHNNDAPAVTCQGGTFQEMQEAVTVEKVLINDSSTQDVGLQTDAMEDVAQMEQQEEQEDVSQQAHHQQSSALVAATGKSIMYVAMTPAIAVVILNAITLLHH